VGKSPSTCPSALFFRWCIRLRNVSKGMGCPVSFFLSLYIDQGTTACLKDALLPAPFPAADGMKAIGK